MKDENTGFKPEEFLRRSAEIIEERGRNYDTPGGERSMQKIVTLFNQLHGTNLSESQGWSFMELLKLVRAFTGTGWNASRKDSCEDQISYTALRAQAMSQEVKRNEG